MTGNLVDHRISRAARRLAIPAAAVATAVSAASPSALALPLALTETSAGSAPHTSDMSSRRSPRRRASSLDVSSIVDSHSDPPIQSRNESIATLVCSGQTG